MICKVQHASELPGGPACWNIRSWIQAQRGGQEVPSGAGNLFRTLWGDADAAGAGWRSENHAGPTIHPTWVISKWPSYSKVTGFLLRMWKAGKTATPTSKIQTDWEINRTVQTCPHSQSSWLSTKAKRQSNGEMTALPPLVLKKTGSPCAKEKQKSIPCILYKNKLKMSHTKNIKPKTVKCLEENQENLCNLGVRKRSISSDSESFLSIREDWQTELHQNSHFCSKDIV